MNTDRILERLDRFEIEVPSWGFADTGTRFGKFLQPAAARTIEEKLEDAGTVQHFTGCAPSVAVHVLWDLPADRDPNDIAALARENNVRIGSINPNLFQDQIYKYGSAASPNPIAREAAEHHILDCIELGRKLGSNLLSLWFADGTNYPGQDDLFRRKRAMQDALQRWHGLMPDSMTMLIEYKPFEPAFYHTDIADWGMAATFARMAGPRAKVLVDTGHHLPGTNVEHIVAFLLDEDLLGGFHFNDRKYADDDLTLGSIDPYAIFRVFVQMRIAEEVHGIDTGHVVYMVDQSHNLKPKVEAMIQTVCTAQELLAKAWRVDLASLLEAQGRMDIVGAEQILRTAFFADVAPLLAEWRAKHARDPDPLAAYRQSGIEPKRAAERTARHRQSGGSTSGSYA
ncbi:MAG: TIM barrel protein [Fimbriimonadaceae bacterium]|nr:TIM barrel protein [Fimbriimonadaceae bacterium]